MKTTDRIGLKLAFVPGLALAFSMGAWAQSSQDPAKTPAAQAPASTASGSAAQSAPAASQTSSPTNASPGGAQSEPAVAPAHQGAAPAGATQAAPSAMPAPGSPVGGDAPLPAKPATSTTASTGGKNNPCAAHSDKKKKKDKNRDEDTDLNDVEPGTAPQGGNCAATVDPNKVVDPGSELIKARPGSIEDVNAVGNRSIGGRGLGNWYSTNSEIKMGRQYADEIEKSTRFITDPVVGEYVNRIGQNIVKNSDCKVPFTIKVIDSDQINAMALPGGFFYVNSGLILAADEEAELAGVMAHEIAHVCAHHAAREMTRMNYAQIGMVPLMVMLPYDWAGLGIYEGTQLAIPLAFLQFSRDFEAQADYLGVQYMYRTGYDPQAFITFFEKIQALQKRKPGLVSKAFADHPQTPDRLLHSQEEIARILPARPEYLVTTSEFNGVKARLARIENKRRLIDNKRMRPSLRRASTNGSGSQSGDDAGDAGDGPPTLHRRDDQN